MTLERLEMLRKLTIVSFPDDASKLGAERELAGAVPSLLSHCAELVRERDEARRLMTNLAVERDVLRNELAATREDRDTLLTERDELVERNFALERERDEARREGERLRIWLEETREWCNRQITTRSASADMEEIRCVALDIDAVLGAKP